MNYVDFCISSCVSFGNLYFSSTLSISSTFHIYWHKVIHIIILWFFIVSVGSVLLDLSPFLILIMFCNAFSFSLVSAKMYQFCSYFLRNNFGFILSNACILFHYFVFIIFFGLNLPYFSVFEMHTSITEFQHFS